MKYQRARILKDSVRGVTPVKAGWELWVQVGRPELIAAHDESGMPLRPGLRYVTHIRSDSISILPYAVVRAEKVELLARSSDDFTDNPPHPTFEQWRKKWMERDAITNSVE